MITPLKTIFFSILFLLSLFFSLNANTIIEKFKEYNTKTFDELLMIRRRIERIYAPDEFVEITPPNLQNMMDKYNNFFYVLIDSGNVGSKMNAFYLAKYIDMITVDKYYIGPINELTIPENISSFVIKPINLSASRGLLIIKDHINIMNNQKFDNNDDIVSYYINKYSDFPEDTEYLVEEFIKDDIRPLQINFYSFNGKTPIVKVAKWTDVDKKYKCIYDDKWSLLHDFNDNNNTVNKIPKPSGFNKALESANKMSKMLGTFIRIDFLVDNKSGVLKMNETSTLPLCAKQYTIYYTKDKSTGKKIKHKKLLLTDKMQKQLGQEFMNCFPFNHPDYKEMYKKSLSYTTPEPCRLNYK